MGPISEMLSPHRPTAPRMKLLNRFFQESLSSLEINGPDCRDAHALSQIFLAAATVQRPNFKPEFLKQGLGIIAEEGNSQGLCTTLWSLTAMNLINRESFTRLAERLTRIEFDETDQGVQQVLMVGVSQKLDPCQITCPIGCILRGEI